jgi:predicted RNase H-like nuclease (RuvC/YqgF family)
LHGQAGAASDENVGDSPLEKTVQEILQRLSTLQDETRVLRDSNLQLNKQMSQIQNELKENVVHQATLEEVKVELQELKARLEYMEAITRKDGNCHD